MTDQLTTFRRKYGYFIPYNSFVTKSITGDAIKNDAFSKYKYIVKLFFVNTQKTVEYVVLASSKKKIRNLFKTKCKDTSTYPKLISVVKFNEQTKLATKAKNNTIKSIINRIKADWEHIRS